MAKPYSEFFYKSFDGLSLYARDYNLNSHDPVLLCMHGLTRNSSDFHNIALHLQHRFRVISVDQRGRGQSDYDFDSNNYRPDIYCQDMTALLNYLGIKQVIAIGTSMGGLVAMIMAAQMPNIFQAVILNDIGPVVDEAGINRLRSYVGQSAIFTSWDAAVAATRDQASVAFPYYTNEDWLIFARRICVENANGEITFDYDMAISEAANNANSGAVPPNLWTLFEALYPTPILVIRGELSDILSSDTVRRMGESHPNCSRVEIPRVGHAPMLDEPESITAIDDFLAPYLKEHGRNNGD